MALRRYTVTVDGSIPVQALLYDDEELLTSQDGVGIYDGSQKSPDHQNGTVSITTHRLFYIDARKDVLHSFSLDLSYVSRTDYYAGLFKSSPKVTCHLAGWPTSGAHEPETMFESWECEVCGQRNPSGLSPSASSVCVLCGVPRTAMSSSSTASPSLHLSTSLPASSISLSASLSAESSHNNNNSGRKQTEIACGACTFLNHPSLRVCEICGTELPKAKAELKSAPSSRPLTPDPHEDDDSPKMIKLSFRKGGDKPFYALLKSSLKSRNWAGNRSAAQTAVALSRNASDDRRLTSTPGLSGILRSVESMVQKREVEMNVAFGDMESLMLKAKDMVKLAAELNEKLTAITAAKPNSISSSSLVSPGEEPEEATFIRSSLSQLGLQMSNVPVTIDMMKDERVWMEELAKELSKVLQGSLNANRDGASRGMMKDKGIIALDEVWGGWNRARGVALIPPSTFLQVIPLLPAYTNPPIQHRAFSSGLNVLHTPPYSHAAFAARLSSHLMINGPKTTMEIATLEEERDLPVGLVSEMVDEVEQDGAICRDDDGAAIVGGGSGTGSEIRWWVNVFTRYEWDGHQ